jgi:hypothetical protein
MASWPARNESSTCDSDVWEVAGRGVSDQAIRRIKAADFIQAFSREAGIRSAIFVKQHKVENQKDPAAADGKILRKKSAPGGETARR